MEGKERLDLANNFAARAVGVEDLIEKAKEGAPDAIDPIAAVGTLIGLGKQARGQEGSQKQFQVAEALLAQMMDPAAQWGQAGTKGGEDGSMHVQYLYWTWLDTQAKLFAVKQNHSGLASAQRRYEQLRGRLAQIGYISQGSVQDRTTRKGGGAGYQWTRKVAQKTVTVSLTAEQFAQLGQAVGNYRLLRQRLREMERLSRKIIFEKASHPSRRKRLSPKVLGLI